MKQLLPLTPTPTKTLSPSRGFTLVELMVAMTIGIIILGAVSQVFVTSRGTYAVEEGLSRLQENGRFAMNFITEDVRMAGYIGCQDQTGDVNVQLNNPGNYPVTGQIVTGHRYIGGGGQDPAADWAPPLPAVFNFGATEVEPRSDVIVVRRASEQAYRLVPPYMTALGSPLQISDPNTLADEQIVMVADCKAADLFQITDLTAGTIQHGTTAPTNGPGNANGTLSQFYGSDAEILVLVTNAYYIGRRNNDPANFPPSLFRKQLENGGIVPRELAENIEGLKFFFGVDTDNTGVANQYLTADAIGAGSPLWGTIASVRMGLVARSPDETGADVDRATYNVVGDTGSPADDFNPADDRRQRRVFTSTVNIRNYTQFTK